MSRDRYFEQRRVSRYKRRLVHGGTTFLILDRAALLPDDLSLRAPSSDIEEIMRLWTADADWSTSDLLDALDAVDPHAEYRFRPRSARALREVLFPRIARALNDGELVALRYDTPAPEPRVVRELKLPPPPTVRRPPPPPDAFYQYRIRVIDDTSAAVAGVRLKLDIAGTPRMTGTNGVGAATVDWVSPDPASLVLLDLPAVWSRVMPHWAVAPSSERPAGDVVVPFVYESEPDSLDIPCGPLVTIVLSRPSVRRVRLVGMLFDGDKCFLLPQALPGVRSVAAMHAQHPKADMLVIGHAESDEVCQGTDVALDRARAVTALLTSEPEAWMPWFAPGVPLRKRWGTREVQLMLSAVSGDDGPFHAGYSSGVTDRQTTAAIRRFQVYWNATRGTDLPVDGRAGAETRKALVTAYMGIEGTTLGDGTTPTPHGCDGHLDDTLTDDGLQPDDRRVEVFFFEAGVRPAASGDVSPSGSPDYPAWRQRLVETVDFETHGIHVQILDVYKHPVAFAKVTITGPTSQTSTADANGFASFFNLTAGDYSVTAVRKGFRIGTTTLTYPTASTLPGRLGTKDARRVRMVGMLFDADKCFLLPQALAGARMVTSMQRDRAGDKVLVVGHADGDEQHGGAPMALARARALVAFLRNDPKPWLAWFGRDVPVRQRWGTRELQLMLSALPEDGAPFYGGYASGVTDGATRAAIRAFQKSAGLAVDGKPGPLTRRALVSKYMSVRDATLPNGVVPAAHGCEGQVDTTLGDDGLQPDDRRLEVFFFENGILPAPDAETSGPDGTDYPEWVARLVETRDFETHGVHVQVIDTRKQPIPFASVHLAGPTEADAVADANGFVSFVGLATGDYTIQASLDGGPPVTSRLHYPTGKTVEGRAPLGGRTS